MSFPVAMVISLLAAMQNNDMEARQRFPRLLQIVAAHPDTVDTFRTKVRTAAGVLDQLLLLWTICIHYRPSVYAIDQLCLL